MDEIYFIFWLGLIVSLLKMVLGSTGNDNLSNVIDLVALVIVLSRVYPMLRELISAVETFSRF
ncbi:hypothetical protein MWH28_12245 [Natroniella sulfidigena]|uniref:SpoIIIAC/SpoIIIAD family protein n=1 Tax=Natroniella sulfidigena TaxID=723921 RepID=UPI00200A04FA|nr:SpoIIIAC/SpoIIIAD family protein [Natroniella sulfidigena]MCK8818127.1 hypothetical protein [Natroniella sulfidigena]